MTTTDELRRMLDERGVEWGNIRSDGSESDYLTEWQFEDNQGKAIAVEWAVGSGLSVETHRYHLTPEQAIAATLGAGQAADEWGEGFRAGCDAANKASEESVEHYKAENAKLRELVRDMMVAWWACDNERCPRHDKRCEEGKFCAFDECARDLGIEVDE